MSVKKLLLNLTLGLSLAFTATVATTPKADAYLLLAGSAGYTPANGPWYNGPLVAASNIALCIVLLPFCILDEQSNGETTISAEHLAANGYSTAEIADIMADQQTMIESLKANNMALKILPQDSKASVARDIKKVNPKASETYINFVTEAAGL